MKEGEGETQRVKNTMEDELARERERQIGREREREGVRDICLQQ